MNPTTVFADCPRDLDVLFVPGGLSTADAMLDPEIVNFLTEDGRGARFVTSLRTGSLLLGQAGLLDGYKAAKHWACYAGLEATGMDAARERVVVDRNRVSGGSVTAGIDFGLRLLAEQRGEETARLVQLLVEYDPKPPFDAATPERAGPELTAMAQSMMNAFNEAAVISASAWRVPEPV